MSEIRMWAVKRPDGELIWWTVRRTRNGALAEWNGRDSLPTWRSWKRNGYRCVRVTVTEVES